LSAAGAVVALGGACLFSEVKGDAEALRIVPAMVVYLAAGVMWILAGTAFRKSRELRGAALAVVGLGLHVASVFLMQAAVP
jgi:hypothetical protein